MKLFRRIVAIALLVLLAVAVFQNQKNLGLEIEFAFLKWSFSLVLGFWLFFAFLGGAALFALIDAWKRLRLGNEIRRRDAEIARLERELVEARRSVGVNPPA
jgi:uncharacterized integral membrane protein